MGTLPENEWGERMRRRLLDEKIIWLTVTDSTSRPQPN